MKERPILFSAPMVRAILEGRKTQTRRVIDGQPLWVHRGVTPIPPYGPFQLSNGALCAKMLSAGDGWNGDSTTTMGVLTDAGRMVRCPYGVPGDRLWVRETLGVVANWGTVQYAADSAYLYDPDMRKAGFPYADECEAMVERWGDDYNANDFKLIPSIFMPRWASRITLEITDVRVQRVQEISEDDAEAEGAIEECPNNCSIGWVNDVPGGRECPAPHCGDGPVEQYQRLWDSINGKTHPWVNNDWVWAVSFRRAA